MTDITERTPASAGVLLACQSRTCGKEFLREFNRQRFCDTTCWTDERNARKRDKAAWRDPAYMAARRRQSFRRRGYGITPEEFDELVVEQGSACSICSKVTTLVPDHCHARSVFRGAICNACNHLLGKAYDDPSILRRAADYLDEVL